ncbi:MAG: amino acid ABC transporter substrate-binding protein [Oscillatoriales cyanobacterium]|nr:MAG: amino acid ABC transporter substrate-binding protein [Oscillatoriales cyanobacterium]
MMIAPPIATAVGLMTLITGTVTGLVASDVQAATPVLDEIRTTGTLRVAIASRAVPLSFRYPDGRLDGYCLDLIHEIATALVTELDLNRRPLIEIVESQLDTRFDLIRSQTVQLECGPNTIQTIEGVTFSEPFLVTGIQFLSPRGSQHLWESAAPEPSDATIVLGALRNSVTARIIADRYPNATIETFAGSGGIRRGIEALQGQLSAFATDSLLLIGELALAGQSLEDYQLSPDAPLACSPYGVLLPTDDPAWVDLVNRVLTSDRGADLWGNWFSTIDRYLQAAEDVCEIEVIPAQTVRAERDRG